MSFRLAWTLILCAAAAGCSDLEHNPPSNVMIPNQTLNVSRSLIVPAESLAAAALVYVIVDPLAPNWQIGEREMGADRYQIALRMKRFTTGGDGEAKQTFNRRAVQVAHDKGAAGYRVIEYTEGIESTVPVAQRVASGVIEFVR